MPIVAWYVLSNVSYMNLNVLVYPQPCAFEGRPAAHLVMRLVLPTLWSPSSTIFVRFGGEEEKSAVTGVEGVSDIVEAKY